MNENNYVISDLATVDSLKADLGKSFPRVKETTGGGRFDILDTFDWRLFHNDLQLIRDGHRHTIVRASTGQVLCETGVEGKKGRKFSWDFPASEFSELLAPVLEMRALLPMADIEKKTLGIAVLNRDDKTVVRLEIVSLTTGRGAHCVTRSVLNPIRGYDGEFGKVQALMEAKKLPQETVPAMVELLQQSGLQPGVYSSKVNVALEAGMTGPRAIQLILKNLVSVMEQNLRGVREDIDTEFLHDFRVAIRRSRSLIGQTKGTLNGETAAGLQAHLKFLGGVSGEVRDLDVYLLKKDAYTRMVPEELKPGIVQLFRSLQRKRRAALDRMLKTMAGEAFNIAMLALQTFLQADPASLGTGETATTVGELARRVIYKRFRRILQKGRRITAETPDEELHELRIDCKKLRYLLEFFTSLFPADQMKRLIRQLKNLQENLGDFNDLSVQQEFLGEYLATLQPRSAQSVMVAAATGGLISRLAMEHQRVRSEFLDVFKTFSSSENKARFKTLFT